MATMTPACDKQILLIAETLSKLLTRHGDKNDLVDIQTELIMISVRATDDECSRDIRSLMHHLIKQMRVRIDLRPK